MGVGIASPRSLSAKSGIAGLTRWQWGGLIVAWLLALGVGYAIYERTTSPAPSAPKGQAVAVQRGSISATVNTTGSVVAGTSSKLGFKSSGRLAELLVQVGDSVEKGQPLARLDQTDLQLQVTQSRAQLATAEAKLAQMIQGSRKEEVSAAEAGLASAKSKLSQLQAGATEADVQSAQASMATAKSTLVSAQAKLADLRAQPKPEDVRAAELQLEKAKNSLWASQIDRDGTCGNPRNAEYVCNSANAKVAAAQTEVTNAAENLKKVSQPAKDSDLQAAEEALASAQMAYDSAVAKLAQVKAGASAADIAAAQSTVESAASQLVLKSTPYTEADLQGAQAGVEQARAGLALAENALNGGTLVAPFAGNVAAVAMNPGEVAGASSTITLVDPKAVRIDTTVDESEIGKLALGQSSEVTFDALPARNFEGKVVAIAPSGNVQSGVVTYLVSLSLNDAANLKPGMTANTSIVYSRKDDVVLVPNRAIRAQGRGRVVEVAKDDGSELRPVQVGISNDQFTEVLEGLQEGEQVVIPTTSTSTPRAGGAMPGGGFAGPMGGGGGPVMIRR